MSIHIAGDFGSCHLGRLDIAKELIHVAKECGLDAVKGQLWMGEKPPNITFPLKYVGELKRYADEIGIDIYFSVWGIKPIIELRKLKIMSIKFSHSQRHKVAKFYENNLYNFDRVYCSYSYLDDPPKFDKMELISYWCIPEYPVPYQIDFKPKIFERFNGFSDHTLSWNQTIAAVRNGAQYIEKHFRLEDKNQEQVPDGKFALKPKELEEMVRILK